MDRIEEARQMLEQMESSRKVLESAHIKSEYLSIMNTEKKTQNNIRRRAVYHLRSLKHLS